MNIVMDKTSGAELDQIGLLVADHVSAMLAYWDKDLVCRFANKVYSEWFGMNRDEMIGKMTLPELLGNLYEKNLPYIELALSGHIQTFERDITTPSGDVRHSIATYYPHIINDEVKGIFVHVADITMVKNLEKELIALLEREKILNELKSRFITTASHEFRTPLTAILSGLSLVEQYAKLGEHDKMKKHIGRIQFFVNNMTEILNDYLSLDRLEQSKVDIEYVSFSLPEFLDEVIQAMTGLLKEGQHIRRYHNGEVSVIHDKKLLRNILINLLSNAIKYSEKNKEIQLISVVNKNGVSLKVLDQGIGISKEDQENLFQTFFRAKNAAKIDGTGLGLTIVKRYVELLRGTIKIDSNIGEGTTVSIEFPRILA
jgi:PAS domain S-box-containing protein